MDNTFKRIVNVAVEDHASEIYLAAGSPPVFRMNGSLIRRTDLGVDQLKADYLEQLAVQLLPNALEKKWTQHMNALFAVGIEEIGRIRVGLSRQRGSVLVSVKLLKTLEERISGVQLHPTINELHKLKSGLVLLTGGTASIRSRSVLSLLNNINKTRACHIVTVEHPIECLFKHDRSLVFQKEVGIDTTSHYYGIQSALDDGADVVFTDQLPDLKTLDMVIHTANRERLVIAMLPITGVNEVIQHIMSSFEANEYHQKKLQFSACLKAIVSHTLVIDSENNEVTAFEVALGNKAIKRLIVEEKFEELSKVIRAYESMGMITFEDGLNQLVQQGLIDDHVKQIYMSQKT